MTKNNFYPNSKVIVVTGGAGQLGKEICRQLSDLGNKVVMADIDKKKCDEAIKELGLNDIMALELDICDQKSIKKAFKKVVEEYGKIDVLINNAGVSVFTPFTQRKYEEFDKVMKVNVYGTFFCTQEALKYMEEQDEGCVVNLGSVYGVVSPDPRIYGDSGRNSPEVYAASKAAVIQMTKYLAAHIKSNKIRVNCVSPGGIFNNQDSFFVENYKKKTPMDRMANEKEVASTILFLCSDASSYINGQNILVDGGFSIW